jgi:4-amino-4-deoxy-L-arabinose transferase-like glycosyltransferase
VRPAPLGLLVATAALYLWGLGASGWANTFYSAAAQAGSESWRAFFFGSSDAASSITVDKPPAATGSTSAAGYQLASRLPVMAVGGFNGSVARAPRPPSHRSCTW